ncbi:precorrin-3B C(17)-methyltransferase [Curvivirga sp.]|uniref:precorrin-3B C(17)-methyltransferase n=1 Tax=Curvivirga sp. TaxID=2856848 RepID=UPI003B5B6B43
MPLKPTAAILILTDSALPLAAKVKSALGQAEIHGFKKRIEEGCDTYFTETISHIQKLYKSGHSIIGICASGILIRAVAPTLGDKRDEPALLSLSEDGQFIIPLLGGHHGANQMARDLASHLNIHAAVTTAGDLKLGFSLDEPPIGYKLENPEVMKPITAALLAGEKVQLIHEAGDESWPPSEVFSSSGEYCVFVTDKSDRVNDKSLVIHPPVLALGVGCERNAPASGLISHVKKQLDDANLSAQSIAAMGSIDIKVDEAAMNGLAKELDIPFRVFEASALNKYKDQLQNPSEIVFKETGCYGVAEGSALSLAGDGGELILPKQKDPKHTMAIARNNKGINFMDKGREAGKLYVIGIGPGTENWRTAEAVHLLQDAEEIVGYQLYLDLCDDLIAGKPTHNSELGEEEARARRALELAAEGKKIALVCSGDPGIYALATLVFELIDRADDRAWNGVDVTVAPGISAFQAAAARIGAPINHDFCTISLSDLLTPREHILKRLNAAGEGDFVISFYNPQSLRRRTLLPEAKEILLKHRPDTTPVVIARNLGRPDETVRVVKLSEFNPEEVDMLTLVMIGNSETRFVERGGKVFVYTPRGYAKKMTD